MNTRVEWVDAARKECERRRQMVPEAGYEEGWIEAADWLFRQQKLNKGSVVRCKELLEQMMNKSDTDWREEKDAAKMTELRVDLSALYRVLKMIEELPAL